MFDSQEFIIIFHFLCFCFWGVGLGLRNCIFMLNVVLGQIVLADLWSGFLKNMLWLFRIAYVCCLLGSILLKCQRAIYLCVCVCWVLQTLKSKFAQMLWTTNLGSQMIQDDCFCNWHQHILWSTWSLWNDCVILFGIGAFIHWHGWMLWLI